MSKIWVSRVSDVPYFPLLSARPDFKLKFIRAVYIISYTVGYRVCPGQLLFLYMPLKTTLKQHFHEKNLIYYFSYVFIFKFLELLNNDKH